MVPQFDRRVSLTKLGEIGQELDGLPLNLRGILTRECFGIGLDPEVRIAVLLALEVRVERGTPFVVLRLIGHRNDRSLFECWTPTIVPPPADAQG